MIPSLIASALVAAQPAMPTGGCALTAADRCRDTNQLMWAAGTGEAIHAFLGDRRADLLYKGHSVADQAIEVLGGPPELPSRIGPYWRFTACRAHSCSEKGALVATPAGGIVAVAILHSRCALATPGNDCSSHDTLTIYIRHAGPDVVRNLRQWGAEQARGGAIPGLRPTTLDAVEIVPV